LTRRTAPAGAAIAVLILASLGACGGSSSPKAKLPSPPAPTGAQAHDAALVRGRTTYRNACAECHGTEGQGGTGPQLGNGAVVRAFPNIDDQITLVENGRGLMPAWKGKLTDEQIRDVVRYEREVL
jgi:mono/diheme cytochrome c family protein